MAKKVAGRIEVVSPGRQSKMSGTGPSVVIEGDPGELTMFAAGRQEAALVTITGDAELAAELRTCSLGI
jgi:hypothetical protein